jgi:hypothetical protein
MCPDETAHRFARGRGACVCVCVCVYVRVCITCMYVCMYCAKMKQPIAMLEEDVCVCVCVYVCMYVLCPDETAHRYARRRCVRLCACVCMYVCIVPR